MKKKLLFICHSSAIAGGAEDEFERLLKYFSSIDKYEVHGMFPDGPRKSIYARYCSRWAVFKYGFFPVINDGISNYLKYFLKFFVQFYKINRFLSQEKYDLFVLNVIVLIWPALILKFKKTKIIFFIRETVKPNFIRKCIYKLVNRLGSYFIPNNQTTEKDFANTTSNKLITTVYPALEYDELFNTTSENIIEDLNINKTIIGEKVKLICVGGLWKKKNQILILEAINNLKNSASTTTPFLFMVGEVDEKQDYVKSIKKYIVKNKLEGFCFFVGTLSKKHLYNIYKHIDIVIISSLSEGLPLTLIEAFKFRKPVISTKVGGIPEIIRNRYNGILIENNKESMSDAITELVTNKDLYKRIVENAHITYEKYFNLEVNMKRIEQIFDSVMNKK